MALTHLFTVCLWRDTL